MEYWTVELLVQTMYFNVESLNIINQPVKYCIEK